ncbi:unnamed protein product [Arctia plantaginis]|uniref:Uncharacterized protein n=1 Tax=Arctia plantaginis TaxID=874455 RepID=A0A8S1BLY5_ARCPL|nr:unnamed protein product [Arctia plantaginis]
MLTVHEMADMVGYQPTDEDHPVLKLEKILREKNSDEDAIANAHFLTDHILKSKTTEEPATPPEIQEPVLPAPESLRTGIVRYNGDSERVRVRWRRGVSGAVRRLAGCLHARPTPRPATTSGPPWHCRGRERRGVRMRSAPAPPTLRAPPHCTWTTSPRCTSPNTAAQINRGSRRGIAVSDRGRFASAAPLHHYRHLRGRGAWEMGASQIRTLPAGSQYMMG